MKELCLGKIKTKDLADWFGISYGAFRNHKEEKLTELMDYCKFEEIYGGVNITEIYDELTYNKKGSRMKEFIKEHFEEVWDASGLDSSANAANKLTLKYGNELTITDNTTYRYILDARNQLFGRPFVEMGTKGTCTYQWCKKTAIDENGIVTLEPFNDEEEAIKKELMKRYFSTDVEKEVMVAEMVQAGEISKADAYDIIVGLKGLTGQGFMAFKAELERQIGYKVIKGTVLFKNNAAEITFDEGEKILIEG